MPPSHETNPVTFPAQDRRTIICSIVLEKLREETGTRWDLLPPHFDDQHPLQSYAQIEVGADDASSTIHIYPLDAILEWKVWNTLSQRRMIRKYFWGRCRFGFRAQSRDQYGLWPVRRHAGMHDPGIRCRTAR